jgi:hypothetical protein
MTGATDRSEAAPAARQLLCVLGMHRSGTSVATQLLHRLGARLGPRLLDAMGDVNDDGFWEDSRIVELNERLLAALGSRWQDCAPLDFGAIDPRVLDELRREAAAHFSANYGAPGLWVVKDPRLCRLLPFWLDIWRETGFETCFVNILRHPFAVAKSLHRRDRIPVEYGVVLWLEYTFDALSHSGSRPGIVVPFDVLAGDPLQVPRLLESQGVQWAFDGPRREEATAGVIKPGLRHHDDSLPGQTGLAAVMAFAANTYAILCSTGGSAPNENAVAGTAQDRVIPDPARLATLRVEWLVLAERHRDDLAMLRRTTDEVMALSAECVRIGTLHTKALNVIRDKDNILDEATRYYQDVLKDRDQEIKHRDQEIKHRDQIILDRTQLIKDIAHLRLWRLLPRIMRRIGRR